MGDMVDLLGEPEHVLAVVGQRETALVSVIFMYPSLGASIMFFDDGFSFNVSEVEVTKDLPVFDVSYFDPKLYEDLLFSTFLLGFYADEAKIAEAAQPWSGFGTYQLTPLED